MNNIINFIKYNMRNSNIKKNEFSNIKMSIEEYFDQKKCIQRVLLEYLEGESNAEENYENFIQVLKDHQVFNNYHELKELLYLINDIEINHRRTNNFIMKIEQIIEQMKNDIIHFFKNSEIFKIFKGNKRLLLFLIEEEIITIDESITAQITSDEFLEKKYSEYFAPEIKQFITEEFIEEHSTRNSCLKNKNFINEVKKEQREDFYDKRKEGENDTFLCELIRTQKTKDFIAHVNKTYLNLESYIETSIFETNEYLMKDNKKIKIIEYAAFFGSNEIIRYMHKNGVKLTPNMWFYAIHSADAELIKYLEDNLILPPNNTYEDVLLESIKCHHNDVSNYIINYLIEEVEKEITNGIKNESNENLYQCSFEYRNYCFFPKNIKHKSIFYFLCEFDYCTLVKLYLEHENIDIYATIIQKNQYFK